MGRVLAAYGAGGFGREVLELGELINTQKDRIWDRFIFIDDRDVTNQVNGYDVFSYPDAIKRYGDSLDVIIAVGEPTVRRMLYDKIKKDGVHMPVLINPDTYVSSTAKLGEGSIIRYSSCVFANAIIGNNVCVNSHANIGHDVRIEDGCMISAFSNIAGAVHIGEYCYIGMNAIIRECVSIGKHSVLSMGTIISDNVPDYALAIGNPVRLMKIGDNFRVFKKKKDEEK